MSSPLQQYEPLVDFSAVISCYYEENSIKEFHTRLSDTLKKTGRSHEIIYINDGSTDKTYENLLEIFDSDPQVAAVLDLSRNVGASNAKTPGVSLAQGKGILFLDSDLQLDPEELPKLIEEYDAGHDLVSGYRLDRQDSFIRKLPSWFANMIMRKAASCDLSDFGCTFKIFDGRLIKAFKFGPFNAWRPVPVISMAGRIVEVPVSHHPRRYGKSGWTFKKLFAYNMENMVRMSERPFQIIGVVCMLLASALAFRMLLSWFFPFTILPQVTNGMILNALASIFLVLLALLCFIGELVIRSFISLQKKPAYVIREMRRREPKPSV